MRAGIRSHLLVRRAQSIGKRFMDYVLNSFFITYKLIVIFCYLQRNKIGRIITDDTSTSYFGEWL